MMGDDFRNRLKDGRPYFTDPVGVWVDGDPGVLDEDGNFVPDEDDCYDDDVDTFGVGEVDELEARDPAYDPSQEYTFVRDQAL